MDKKKEIRHLETKISLFEDMMLRSKNYGEIEKIRSEITSMRFKLQRMKWEEGA